MSNKRTHQKKLISIFGWVLFFCLCSSLVFAAAPKTTTIQGKVTDAVTMLGVSNAAVSVYDPKGALLSSGRTDSKGGYKLTFPVRVKTNVSVKTEAVNYQTQTKSISVQPEKRYTVNFSLTQITPILSISVNPKLWNMGLTEVNKIITMAQINKITITNDGAGQETFTLSLINPPGWTTSSSPGRNIYVLSGLFCNSNDIPGVINFNQNFSNEDVITTKSKTATQTTFGYRYATANGVSVPQGRKRSLYLQFKSPTVTDRTQEQNISVIISCQMP